MQAGMLRLATLLSVCAIVGVSTAGLDMALAGCWTNELGSIVWINVMDAGGFEGSYTSKASVSGEVSRGDIVGYQQDITQPTFGFVVKWATAPADSVTVWAGQYYNGGGKEQLNTMWLLRLNRQDPKDNWGATLAGMDVFTRVDPAVCQVTDDRSEL
ncbi:avidin-like [Scyliorhinus canicula]|uniref:avidin-like n=1 Tax=Scyliorhinus canicula TaxID=7830 RepID=UPI0018F5F66C|nr:avidin-like [Scyliorhinus canicula]